MFDKEYMAMIDRYVDMIMDPKVATMLHITMFIVLVVLMFFKPIVQSLDIENLMELFTSIILESTLQSNLKS